MGHWAEGLTDDIEIIVVIKQLPAIFSIRLTLLQMLKTILFWSSFPDVI